MMGWNGKAKMWFASRGKAVFSGKEFEEVWLWAMGYGTDQAAGLRYLMDKVGKDN